MEKVVHLLKSAESILLTTHKQCDGDGLGAELGLFHALKKMGKKVDVVNVDSTPAKYGILKADEIIQYFDQNSKFPQAHYDLCLIFDTNDYRLIEPLYSAIEKNCTKIVFIDHHPVLSQGPLPTADSVIDTSASSTGEMSFRIIKGLGVELDLNIARAIYLSIVFDTQLYKYIRSSPVSHQIAAELLQFPVESEEIHRALYSNQTIEKVAFLGKALSRIEYSCQGKLAILKIDDQELSAHNLTPDDSRDVIDMIMNIETLEAAALIRAETEDQFKVSFRSKSLIEVLAISEKLGGGGHKHASGAYVQMNYELLKKMIIEDLSEKLSRL